MSLEPLIQAKGREIFERSGQFQSNLFNKSFWSGKMMEWSMKYPEFKTEMFRFVDLLPALNDSDQVADHIRQYFLREGLNFPAVIRAGLGVATSNGLTARLAAASIRKNVEAMATTFITGQDAKSARKTLQKLWSQGFSFTVDILGEAALSEKEAIAYQKKYQDLVTQLADEVAPWSPNSVLESSPLGAVPRANVSVKCSSLFSQIDVAAFRNSVDAIKARLRPILLAAKNKGTFVNLDMEQFELREMFMTVAEELFLEPELKSYPHLGIVVQAYLKTAQADIERIAGWATQRGTRLTVRLVKGAYWDFEVVSALQKDWPIPVFLEKPETDKNYEACVELLLGHYPHIQSAFGSHNVRNLAFALSLAEQKGLDKTAFEVQMLFGMAEPFKKALQSMGYRVREYAPVGELLSGMAYLVRRLLENTSNEGFLRQKFVDQVSSDALLADPLNKVTGHVPEMVKNKESVVFKNEAFQDFSQESARVAIEAALKKLKSAGPTHCSIVIGGKIIEGRPKESLKNPSRLSETVSSFSIANREDAELALKVCDDNKAHWAAKPVADRAAVLNRAAEIMRSRKAELTAQMVLEVGKTFREADADVCEAIDFCTYYAQEMLKLDRGIDTSATPGETNRYVYQPRGLTIAIAPWNFPLAILCGMAVGPLVAGNAVIMKPAETAPGIAAKLFDILIEAGCDAKVLALVPGPGEIVGAALVASPKTHIINFTGSRAVGLMLVEQAARVEKGQRHVKRVVAEMGGKNALIIDDDADLDEAVLGSLSSAFGFQGQKCSALSRLLVHESCYDKFKKRFVEALESLSIGPSDNPAHRVGPVIDEESQKRLLGVVERNKSKIVAQLKVPEALLGTGHYVPPTVFESDDPTSELGQNEFFGPLVTLFKVKNFDDAVRVFNDVDYALTGGIFSRSPVNLEKAKKVLECGNLYVNRGITGALVYRHPFGGFKLSGLGAKAGGPDYLLQFLEPRTISENTMRRGFAPETAGAQSSS